MAVEALDEQNVETAFTVKLHEPMLVVPVQPTKQESYFLSNLDQNLVVVMHAVYFFKEGDVAAHHAGPAEVMRRALEQVLVLYYPLAGRFSISQEGKLEVLCNDKGALFVEADAEGSIEDFAVQPRLGQGIGPNLMKFIYTVAGANVILDIPPLVVQVTKFRRGGFALGLSTHHTILDGIATVEFLKSWGEIARGVPLSVLPCLDKNMLKARDPLQIDFPHPEFLDANSPVANQVELEKNNKLIFKLISFDEKLLNSLKRSTVEEGLLEKCSTFEALSALVWKCRTLALGIRSPSKNTKLLFAVDLRNKLEPPLPKGYVGNGIILACALTSTQDLVEGSLSHAIELIREAIARIDNAYIRSFIDFYEKSGPRLSMESTLVITTWSRLPFHTIDFGWGTPFYEGLASLPAPEVALFLPEGEQRKGIKLVLGLPDEAMEKFMELIENSWIRSPSPPQL